MSKEYMLDRIMAFLIDADEQIMRIAFAFISGITTKNGEDITLKAPEFPC